MLVDTAKAFDGLRPPFSAHVRFGERGAPVRFPPTFPPPGLRSSFARFAQETNDQIFNDYLTVAMAPLGPGIVLGS
jgi:hypothetical protein